MADIDPKINENVAAFDLVVGFACLGAGALPAAALAFAAAGLNAFVADLRNRKNEVTLEAHIVPERKTVQSLPDYRPGRLHDQRY